MSTTHTGNIESALIAELPTTSPGTDPLWCENYFLQAYSSATRTGLVLHLSRVPYARDLWRELVIVYLPDDRFAIHKGYGSGAHDTGPGGGTLRMFCDDPLRSFRASVRGAARVVEADELHAGGYTDGEHRALELDVTFATMAPIWNQTAHMWNQPWADTHYELFCTVSGTVRVDGETIPFEGTGVRDHSRGSRDLSVIDRHLWLTGEFEDGRTFGLITGDFADDPAMRLNLVHLTVDGVGYEGRVVSMLPNLAPGDDPSLGYELTLESELGRSVITAEILQLLPMGFDGRYEWILGSDPRRSHDLFEAQARYSWDGVTGYGLTERSRRLPDRGPAKGHRG